MTVSNGAVADASFKMKVNANYMAYHDSSHMQDVLKNVTQVNPQLATIYRSVAYSYL